jgi:molybdate transport system substrate-binding protein
MDRNRHSFALLVLIAALLMPLPGRAAEPVRIYAAASLTGAFTDISKAGERAGFAPCACVHAASSTLARQIAAGAPADIFISANPAWMDFLVERHLNSSPPRQFTRNTLVLVSARKGFTFKFASGHTLTGALNGEWLALADPDHVPAGIYAKAGLKSLGQWDAISDRIARAANVRAALALVTRNEAIAGVVYGSDAAGEPRVWIADSFPPDSHPPIRYMAALIGKSPSPDARAYDAFLASPEVRAILGRFGFQPMS